MEVNVAININVETLFWGANVFREGGGVEICTMGRNYLLPGRANISSPQ